MSIATRIAPWIAAVALSCGCSGQIDLDYSPAFISTVGIGVHELVVFPGRGQSFSLPMPAQLGAAAYAPDGRAIYTAPHYPVPIEERGLFKIQLHPVKTQRFQRSPNFVNAYSIAVSSNEEKIYIAGDYKSTDERKCGVFEFEIQSGSLRQILVDPECKYLSSWGPLSLSPDNRHAAAFRKPNLELIDLTTGAITSLGPSFLSAAYSPDGKWLAAIDSTASHTILMDARTLDRKKVLEISTATWSPDSKYLLGVSGAFCGPYHGTMRVIDVATGSATSIASSQCKIDSNKMLWISKSVQP